VEELLPARSQEVAVSTIDWSFTEGDVAIMIEACNEADESVPEGERAGPGEQSKAEWESTWLRCPLEGLRDEIWNKTPGDPMKKEDLLAVLYANEMITGSDYDFINEEAHKVQEGVEPAPDGMISFAEWTSIWTKTALNRLRDSIWVMCSENGIMKEEVLYPFLKTGKVEVVKVEVVGEEDEGVKEVVAQAEAAEAAEEAEAVEDAKEVEAVEEAEAEADEEVERVKEEHWFHGSRMP